MTPERLMREAERARRTAYAPYSRLRVGAALLTAEGEVIHGCNVENASYGLSVCAERVAVWKAVAAGRMGIVAVAISVGRKRGAPPCGACRQVLWEFAPLARVSWRDRNGRIVSRALQRLLPEAFELVRKGRR